MNTKERLEQLYKQKECISENINSLMEFYDAVVFEINELEEQDKNNKEE